MKRIVAIVGLLCMASFALANNFGIGIQRGIAQNDPKDLQKIYDAAPTYGWTHNKLSKNATVFALEALYEFGKEDKVGVKLGVEGYGQNKLELDFGDCTIKEKTYAVPITIYYKKDYGVKGWSGYIGGGVTVITSKIKFDYYGYKEATRKSKVFPHFITGIEYRFSKFFALGIEAKCNISAEVKKDGDVLSDRSGVGASLTGRFYF